MSSLVGMGRPRTEASSASSLEGIEGSASVGLQETQQKKAMPGDKQHT
jgi:hypothetical protein